MNDTATYRRTLAAVGLIMAAAMSLGWTALEPPFPDGYDARLAAIESGGAGATTSAVLFVLSQLPMLAAVLGISHLVRQGSPVLSNLGGTLAVIGVFGHSVFGGMSLVSVLMAHDTANRDVHAALLQDLESSPLMAFAAAGLIGTVLGLLLLAIGLWRSRVVARWVPALLWAFLVVEFVGSNLSDYAAYVAGVCLLVAFGALARSVWQSPREGWQSGPAKQPAVVAAA